MATSFPSSLDSFTNPLSSDTLSSPSHAGQHTDLNDAVAALQSKVGADSSAVAASLDYKVAQLEAASTGKILQVVSTSKTDSFTTTSTSLVDVTDVSVSITPTSATSKVLILCSGVGGNTGSSNATFFQFVRDSTDIGSGTGGVVNATGMIYNNNANAGTGFSLGYLDSPATTSATTYKLQARVNGGIGVIGRIAVNDNNRVITTITAFEVTA